ncbi:hypothetical protein [Crenobacter cavernae]|uniref:hypothetical protein n=1 Tax=Crenobacter cavernae TaxID=2290923 RepID=UPI0011C078AA|nr:hypothetical protein [Crenobacter cavernae]
MGFTFQDQVALNYALRMLDEPALIAVYAEATGNKGSTERVFIDDIILSFNTGAQTFVQVKSASPGKAGWSIRELSRANELGKLISQLALCHTSIVELVCPHGFGDLEELRQDTRQYFDLAAFQGNASAAAKKRLSDFCRFSSISEESAFCYLARIQFGERFSEEGWRKQALNQIARHTTSTQAVFNALLILIRDHQAKNNPALPSLLTVQVIREILLANDSTQLTRPCLDDNQRGPWRFETERHVLGIRLIRIDEEGQPEDSWEKPSPRFDLAIRPRNDIGGWNIDGLVKSLQQGSLVLPSFSPLCCDRLARSVVGIHSYETRIIPPPPSHWLRRLSCALFGERFTIKPERIFSAFNTLYTNGELVLSDALSIYPEGEQGTRVFPPDFEQRFVATLDSARAALRTLGCSEPYEVRVNIIGVGGLGLTILDAGGNPSEVATPEGEAAILDGECMITSPEATSLATLMPFFEKVWHNFHYSRPDHYDQLAILPVAAAPG